VSILESASACIGEEIARVPKASGGDRKSNVPRVEHLKSGREATGIPRVSRSRYQKLARLKDIAEKLRESGHTHAKAAKASLDGSCRCVLRGGALRRAGVERRASSYLDALPSVRRQVALPMCRANDPRLL
jgi:hypothetical protein